MDLGVWGAILGIAFVLLLFVLEVVATWGLGGWMEYVDRRGTRTREKAEADLAEYGPTAVGLREELLPEDLRQYVREERARRGTRGRPRRAAQR